MLISFVVAVGTQSAKLQKLSDQVFSAPKHVRKKSESPRRRMRQLSEVEVAELVAAREAGAQIKELASRFGVHKSTVLAHLDRAGVPGRRWAGKTLTPEQVRDAVWLYQSGLNLIEVGARFGVDRRQVSRALKEAGFALRPPGQQSHSTRPP